MATAKGQRNASVVNSGLYSANLDGLTNILGTTSQQAGDAIRGGRDSAVGALQGNADSALGALGTGYGQARTDLTGGYGQARTDTQTGIDLFNPWVANGQAASNAQNDFLGLNGAGASGAQQAALDQFRNSTGYQDVLNQSSDAALRKASVIGGLGGNQADALARIGGNLANQTNQQYFTNLGGVSQTGLQAAGQQQQGYGQLAQLGAQQGTALAGLSADQAGKEAGVYTNLGNSLGNVFTGTGAQEAGVYTGLGNSLNQLGQYTTTGITNGVTEAGKASDAAKTGNQNLALGIGGQVLGLGLGGGNTVGGSLLSGLGSFFK
jgi:hypothetical protein